MVRLRAKRDANHADVVKALRAAGRRVLDLGAVGKGCPDLLVWWPGGMALLEVKVPGGRLTPDQEAFIAAGWPVVVVRSPAEALRATGVVV